MYYTYNEKGIFLSKVYDNSYIKGTGYTTTPPPEESDRFKFNESLDDWEINEESVDFLEFREASNLPADKAKKDVGRFIEFANSQRHIQGPRIPLHQVSKPLGGITTFEKFKDNVTMVVNDIILSEFKANAMTVESALDLSKFNNPKQEVALALLAWRKDTLSYVNTSLLDLELAGNEKGFSVLNITKNIKEFVWGQK